MWPLTIIISSGRSRPVTSATILRDGASGSVAALICKRTTIFSPRSCIRCIISASSTVIAACGILGTPLLYNIAPVCGDLSETGVTDRIRLATAPALAASIAPSRRIRTVRP